MAELENRPVFPSSDGRLDFHAENFYRIDDGATTLLFDHNNLFLYAIDGIMGDVLDHRDTPSAIRHKYPENEFDAAADRLRCLDALSMSAGKRAHRRRADADRLASLWLNLSHACNMACIYCFAGGGAYGRRAELMGDDVARRGIDRLFGNPAAKRLRLVFFGGEPLLNVETLKYCVLYGEEKARETEKPIDFFLITNGTIIDEEIADFIKNHDVTVQVSLDGPKEQHDRMRPYKNGRGTYDTILANVQKLREAGVEVVNARATITRHNRDIQAILGHFHGLGFDNVGLVPVMGDPATDYALTEDDARAIAGHYGKLADAIVESIAKNEFTDLDPFSPILYRLRTKRRKHYFCGAGHGFATLTPGGELYPCHRLVPYGAWSMGTVMGGEMATGDKNAWDLRSVDDKPTCRTCWARYLCGGGCAANAIERNGDLNEPEKMMCTIMKSVIKNALRIYYVINTLPEEKYKVHYEGDDTYCL